jgi:DNA-directed RNA polymerase specialized sigma24 family protein
MMPPIDTLLDIALCQSGLDPASRQAVISSALHALWHAAAWPAPANWSDAEWDEDQQEIACAEAWRAAHEYDPLSGLALGAYVYQHVRSKLRVRYRQEWSYGSALSFRPIGELEGGGSSPAVESPPETAVPDPAQLAMQHELRVAVEALPEPYGSLLVRVFLQGATETEVATHDALTQSGIDRRKTAALRILRKRLIGAGHPTATAFLPEPD